MMNNAEILWQQIIAKGSKSDKDFIEKLNLQPGAREEDFELLKNRLGIEVPEEVKAIYRVHNGQDFENDGACFIKNLTLSPIDLIIEDWEFLNEEFDPDGLESKIAPEIKPFLWNPKWIPIAGNGGGDYVCIDTDPTVCGVFGQVLYFYHDWGNRSVTAKSLFEFIKTFLNEG